MMTAADNFIVSILAQILTWEVIAYVILPHGSTITQRVEYWTAIEPNVPVWYLALCAIGYVHFFGFPKL